VTFSAAIACNGASFAAVEAIPSMSKNIPITKKNKTSNIPTTQVTFGNMAEEKLEKIAANTKVITAIVILNLIELFICSFINIIPYFESMYEEWSLKKLRLRLRSSRFSQINT